VSSLRRGLDRGLGALLSLLMGLAVANVVWQVVSRYVLGDPSSFTDELARYLLVWIGLLGAAYGVGQRMHLAVDLLPARLGARMSWLAECCVIAFAVAVPIWGGLRLVSLTGALGQTSAALGIPLAAVYVALPLSGVAMLAYAVLALAERRGEEPAGD